VADRKRLAFSGMVLVSIAVDDKGSLFADPEVSFTDPGADQPRRADVSRFPADAFCRRRNAAAGARRDPDSAFAEAIRLACAPPSWALAQNRTSPCICWGLSALWV